MHTTVHYIFRDCCAGCSPQKSSPCNILNETLPYYRMTLSSVRTLEGVSSVRAISNCPAVVRALSNEHMTTLVSPSTTGELLEWLLKTQAPVTPEKGWLLIDGLRAGLKPETLTEASRIIQMQQGALSSAKHVIQEHPAFCFYSLQCLFDVPFAKVESINREHNEDHSPILRITSRPFNSQPLPASTQVEVLQNDMYRKTWILPESPALLHNQPAALPIFLRTPTTESCPPEKGGSPDIFIPWVDIAGRLRINKPMPQCSDRHIVIISSLTRQEHYISSEAVLRDQGLQLRVPLPDKDVLFRIMLHTLTDRSGPSDYSIRFTSAGLWGYDDRHNAIINQKVNKLAQGRQDLPPIIQRTDAIVGMHSISPHEAMDALRLGNFHAFFLTKAEDLSIHSDFSLLAFKSLSIL